MDQLNKTIAFPHPAGHGGPGSFQSRFEKALKKRGWKVVYAESEQKPDIVMIVGGTKRLLWLWRMRRAGIPIVYRLDGINWLHRKKRVGAKPYILGEARNLLNKCIHAFFADHVVYQSQFVKTWWEKESWKKHKNTAVIYNGVDLSEFHPQEAKTEPDYLLCLEGNIDYSPYAVDLINELAEKLKGQLQVLVYGSFEDPENSRRLTATINYGGKVGREQLPQVYKNAIYLSLDVNAACPNTVVESLASGLPVVGFATGALGELVTEKAGAIVPYGSDPWKLSYPDADALYVAIRKIQNNYSHYASEARLLAENRYDFEQMLHNYLGVIEKVSAKTEQLS